MSMSCLPRPRLPTACRYKAPHRINKIDQVHKISYTIYDIVYYVIYDVVCDVVCYIVYDIVCDIVYNVVCDIVYDIVCDVLDKLSIVFYGCVHLPSESCDF
jgi:hypothetical protein